MKWKMKNPMTNVVKIPLLYWFTFRWDVIYREHKQNMIDWQAFFCSHLNTYIGLAIALRHYWYVQNMHYYSFLDKRQWDPTLQLIFDTSFPEHFISQPRKISKTDNFVSGIICIALILRLWTTGAWRWRGTTFPYLSPVRKYARHMYFWRTFDGFDFFCTGSECNQDTRKGRK